MKDKSNFLLILVSVTLFLELMDIALVSSCIVPMAKTFNVNIVEISSSIIWYVIGTCIFVPGVAWASRIISKPHAIFYTLIAFIVTSFLCGIAPNVHFFAIARFLQGVSIASCTPLATIMLMDTCKKEKLTQTIGLINMPALLGSALGPLVGTIFAHYLTWRYAFYINIPICIILLISVYLFLLKDYKPIQNKSISNTFSFDFSGFILLSLSLILISISINKMVTNINITSITLLLLGILMGVSFYALSQQKSKLDKVIILRLEVFNDINFKFGTYINIIARTTMCGIPIIMAIILQSHYNLSIMVTGFYLAVIAIAGAIAKFFSKYLNRIGLYRSIAISTSLTAASIFSMQYTDLFLSNGFYWVICALFGFNMSLLYTSMNTVMLISIKNDLIADACNIQAIIQQLFTGFGLIIAIAVFHYALKHYTNNTLAAYQLLCTIFALLMLLTLCCLQQLCKRVNYIRYVKRPEHILEN